MHPFIYTSMYWRRGRAVWQTLSAIVKAANFKSNYKKSKLDIKASDVTDTSHFVMNHTTMTIITIAVSKERYETPRSQEHLTKRTQKMTVTEKIKEFKTLKIFLEPPQIASLTRWRLVGKCREWEVKWLVLFGRTAIPWESWLNTCMLLVHGFQAREIRVHVGSAPLNGRGRNKNSYQEGCAGCVTSDRWQAAVQEIADPGNLCRFTQSLDWASFTENSLIFSLRFWIEVFLWASALLRKHFISPQWRRHWTRDAGLHLHYQCLSSSFPVAHRKVLFEEKKMVTFIFFCVFVVEEL